MCLISAGTVCFRNLYQLQARSVSASENNGGIPMVCSICLASHSAIHIIFVISGWDHIRMAEDKI